MMYKNYIKTGWRFIKKHKLYSGLNIFGLAMGIAFCWLAYLYANDETSFDQHLSAHESLYRIVIDFNRNGETHYIGGSSNAMSIQFDEQIPEIESVARITPGFGLIKKGDEAINQSYLIADKELINYLDLEFLEGTGTSFDQPNDVIISASLAGRLDIRGKAVGQVLSLTSGADVFDFIIRGVYKDIPENTSVKDDMIISFQHYIANTEESRLTQWFDVNMNSLIKLANLDAKTVAEQKMNHLHQENHPDKEESGSSVTLKLQPIEKIHLDENYGHYNGIDKGGNPELIRMFAVIGIFCLIISMINYSNFNISLYINRAREVALRKVIGAEKSSIFSQLITESFLSAAISGILAIILLLLMLPLFSEFVQKNYEPEYLLNPSFFTGALGILILVAFASGLYPAIILSRFKIIKSLKGEQKIKSGKWITQSLLGVQFIIATILVSGMLTMQHQIRHLTTFDTKVNTEGVIYMDFIRGSQSKAKQFVHELTQLPEVASAAAISSYNGTGLKGKNKIDVRHLRIHNDLMTLLDIDIVKGRNFDPEIGSDRTSAVLVNEALVKKLGLENPVGDILPFDYGDLKNPKIIGVVEDYHFKSAKSHVEPLVIYQAPVYRLQSVYVKLSTGTSIDKEKFEKVWAKYFDPYPLDFSYLDEVYQRAYLREQRMLKLVSIGCMVSIFLAAMGLLGIVGLQLSQRLKEISIRKVLGASSGNLYSVFTKRFLLVIVLGMAGGLIIGYSLIQDWLNNYPYHVDFGWKIMSYTIFITLIISMVTIFSQVFKIMKTNPVQYLKDE